MLNDFKFTVRQLRKSPGFTLTAVLTLALGPATKSNIGDQSSSDRVFGAEMMADGMPARRAAGVNPMTTLRME